MRHHTSATTLPCVQHVHRRPPSPKWQELSPSDNVCSASMTRQQSLPYVAWAGPVRNPEFPKNNAPPRFLNYADVQEAEDLYQDLTRSSMQKTFSKDGCDNKSTTAAMSTSLLVAGSRRAPAGFFCSHPFGCKRHSDVDDVFILSDCM